MESKIACELGDVKEVAKCSYYLNIRLTYFDPFKNIQVAALRLPDGKPFLTRFFVFSELYLLVSKLANGLHAGDMKIIFVVPPLAINDMA